jgi:phthiocerol/phenolphthiocerol synthesis type-I polyketide synthase E
MRYEPIAIVGMAGRFPASKNLDEFRDNLFGGADCLTDFSEEELLDLGEEPELLDHPEYVRRRPVLADADAFDERFFGLTSREAEIRDPQFRLFLETAHASLEHAGYDPAMHPGHIGLYAGANIGWYRHDYIEGRPDLIKSVGTQAVDIANAPDYLATFVSYKLGLRGPSMTVLTACSTSLVAIHLACGSIRLGDCDMAIAGGVDVEFPFNLGYVHIPGGITADDGVPRPFDERATGTNFGNGVGAVVLKPLAAAITDRDTIYAVIRGSAINNDGDRKVGFTAPSVAGQSECIQRALRAADVHPSTISYVEAHGTATPIGDPIEITALTDAYHTVGGSDLPTQYCAIGSVKSNIGHLAQAAGVAGLIKTALALKHARIPASINVSTPNKAIDWAGTPFFVATRSIPWPAGEPTPRRAAVSSFGIGGTNAHVIVEEAPARQPPAPAGGRAEAVVWSGIDKPSADGLRNRLAEYFAVLSEEDFADAAHTLRLGRAAKQLRCAVVATGAADAALALRDHDRIIRHDGVVRQVVLAFPEHGDPGAFRDLYASEPLFRQGCAAAFDKLRPISGSDLRTAWEKGDERILAEPVVAESLTYLMEYTLAHCLMHWGVRPHVLLGNGVGELAACAVAGTLDFKSGLHMVAAARSRWPAALAELTPREPDLAVVSARTGAVITPDQVMSPAFWTRLSNELPDADATAAILADDRPVMFLEVGPGSTVTARSHRPGNDTSRIASVLPSVPGDPENVALEEALARLWVAGEPITYWQSRGEHGYRRIAAPGYPYDRRRFWVNGPSGDTGR